MNREQKAATIQALAAEIQGADAVFAVDYRGISVPQAAELRTRLRAVDASFRVVKNSLTERAADQAGAESLKVLLDGPTALTFVHGDAALAAKAIADYGRTTQLLPFKGGLMDGDSLDLEQVRAISRLPSRDVLYGQLVGVVAAPVTGLVRTLSALVGGLAVALSQVREKKESGEIPAGEPPVAEAASPVAEAAPPVDESPAEEAAAPTAEAPAEAAAPAAAEPAQADEAAPPAEETPAEATAPAAAEEAQAEATAPPTAEPAATPAEGAPPIETEAPDRAPLSDEAPAEEAAPEAAPVEAESPAAGADAGAAPTDQAEPESAPAQEDNQADASA
jgi:large subunit ribosomal protein L10